MIKDNKINMKLRFSYLMLFIALSVASCAAYFSVWGLSQLFAGASIAVIIMASILEVGKIVTTTALHRYWDKLGRGLKIYLTSSVIILMLITSAGIYGFLSNAYQKTANKLEIHDGEIGVLNSKKNTFNDAILANNRVIETKNKRLDQLSGLRTSQESRMDNSSSNRIRNNVRGDIGNADREIQKISTDIDVLNTKNYVLSDSVSKYDIKVLDLKSGSEIAGEVGPLKYIAELTGIPMAKVVNYLILLLIFVFDPLSIALILMTNKIFQLEGDIKDVEPKEIISDVLSEYEEHEDENISTDFIDNVPEEISEKVSNDMTTKIVLEDIKDRNRGYSVQIPPSKSSNTIERIGSNKIVKNGDNNKVFFKRNQ